MSVILSFFSPALYYWGDLYASTYLGLARTRELMLIQFAIDNNIKFTLHGNTPETPINIPLMLWSATSRQGLNGDVYGQGQTITAFQALEAVTKTAAESNKIDNIVGTIQEGKFADLVILDKNPLDIHPTLLRILQIEETIINGKTVFDINTDQESTSLENAASTTTATMGNTIITV